MDFNDDDNNGALGALGGLESCQLDENWNQLQVNEEKFNLKTGYKEEDYTTELNMHQIDNRTKNRVEGFIKVPLSPMYHPNPSLGNHEQDCVQQAPKRGAKPDPSAGLRRRLRGPIFWSDKKCIKWSTKD